MTFSIHAASIPVFARALRNLDGVLAKAADHAAVTGVDVETYVGMRLAPDMDPLLKQIQRASDSAKGAATRLAGLPSVALADDEATFADLRGRIARTLEIIEGVDPAALDGAEDRTVVLSLPSGALTFTGQSYLLGFALPNFFFHVTTAYAILRHAGVPLGKMDYLGRPQT